VQSGSDRVLGAMNRRTHTPTSTRPRSSVCGGPGRIWPCPRISSSAFLARPIRIQATLDLVAAIGYAQAFSFKYSPRPGTPAAAAEDQVPEPIKTERLTVLQALLLQQQGAFNAACIGRVLPVLFEKPGRHQGQLSAAVRTCKRSTPMLLPTGSARSCRS